MERKTQTYCQEKNLEPVFHNKFDCAMFNNCECSGCKTVIEIVKARESKVKIEIDQEHYY